MQVFAVFGVSSSDVIAKALAEHYPNDHLEVEGDSFLVAAAGVTSKDLATRLGIEPGADSLAIVAPVYQFWGCHHANVWEWINVKAQQNGT